MGDDTALCETPVWGMRVWLMLTECGNTISSYPFLFAPICPWTEDILHSVEGGQWLQPPCPITGWRIVSSYASTHSTAWKVCVGLGFNAELGSQISVLRGTWALSALEWVSVAPRNGLHQHTKYISLWLTNSVAVGTQLSLHWNCFHLLRPPTFALKAAAAGEDTFPSSAGGFQCDD